MAKYEKLDIKAEPEWADGVRDSQLGLDPAC
jgi:hypothetical protein